MDVDPEHVRDAVQRVPGVQRELGAQRGVGVDLEDPEVGQALGQDALRRGVRCEELGARSDRVNARLLGGEHELVDLALAAR